MGRYTWIKLYTEILDDPKMGRLPNHLWRRAIELFLLAGKNGDGGTLPSVEEMAWTLHLDKIKMLEDIRGLAEVGVVQETQPGKWVVVNFTKRQTALDSTERSRALREREKEGQKKEAPVSWAKSLYESIPESPGVYRIYCTESGMNYIGASKNLRYRVKQHLSEMKNIRGHAMYEDFQKHGKGSIQVFALEEVGDFNELSKREAYWMTQFPNNHNSEAAKHNRHWKNNATDFTNNATDCPLEEEGEEDLNTEREIGDPVAKKLSTCKFRLNTNSGVIIQAWKDDFPDDVILRAIDDSIGHGARSFNYVDQVLYTWKASGIPPTREERAAKQPRKSTAKMTGDEFDASLKRAVETYQEVV